MPKSCPSCGAEVPDQFQFCGYCAAPLEPASQKTVPSPPPAEERTSRRVVAVLFADLTNFTQAAAQADPEQVYFLIRSTLERLASPVRRLGGRIDRYVGDGFLATFGIPEAHDNDPARALMAALEMQRTMMELRVNANQSLGWDAQLRVGINAGAVISGQVGTGLLRDSSVFGHTVNLASRLQSAARPATVLVSDAVYRRTRAEFIFLEPVQLQLKGIDEPVIGYELVQQRSAPQSTRGLSGRHTPLVGRAAEYAALVQGLQRVRVERRGIVAVVSGEAGIGKSRLVDEVIGPLEDNMTVLRARCSPYESSSYALVKRLLEALAGIQPEDPIHVRLDRVDELLSLSTTLAREVGPVFRSLVADTGAEEKAVREPQQEQRRIFAALRRMFAWLARREALLIVLDDVQWCDPSSLDVLDHVVDLVDETPLSVLAIIREGELEARPHFLTRAAESLSGAYLPIQLQPLSHDDADQLVHLLLSEVDVPGPLARSVFERAGGNPLLIEELVRMLLDEGILRETDSGWRIDKRWAEMIKSIPGSVNGLILRRYDRLPPDLKRTLDMASVLGPSFHQVALAAMADMSPAELRAHADRLERADFIRRAAGVGSNLCYFRHTLMQEVIYESILLTERQSRHLKAAEVMRDLTDGLVIDSAAAIGRHLELGGSLEASSYLLRAAAQAAERHASEEAIAQYRRVEQLFQKELATHTDAVDAAVGIAGLLAQANQLEIAREKLGDALDLSCAAPVRDYRIGDIDFLRGNVSTQLGSYEEAISAYHKAHEALQDAPHQCRLFSATDIERGLGWVQLFEGNLAAARQHGETGLALAHAHSDVNAQSSAHTLLAAVHYWAGDIPKSVDSASKALALREQNGDVWGAASAQTTLGTLYHRLGDWPRAETFLRQAIFVQHEIGDYRNLGLSWSNLGLLLLDGGREQEAMQCMHEALATLPRQDHSPVMVSTLYLNRGVARIRSGDLVAASSDFEVSLRAAEDAQNDQLRALALAYLAEACSAIGDCQRAKEWLAAAEGAAGAAGSPEIRAEVLRVRYHLLVQDRDWSAALEANQRAQELYESLGNQYEVARRKMEAVKAHLAARELDEGSLHPGVRPQVESALRTFRTLGARSDVLDAEDLLARLGAFERPEVARDFAAPRRPAAVLSVKVFLPEPAGEQQAEHVAIGLERLTAELRGIGARWHARVVDSCSGMVLLFTDQDADGAQRLALKAAECALDLVEASARTNATLHRQYGLEVPIAVGAATGQVGAEEVKPTGTAIFASASQPARQARAAADLAPKREIILTAELARSIRAGFEVLPFEYDNERRLHGPIYRLGRPRAESRVAQPLPGSCPQLVGRDVELGALHDWIDGIRTDASGRVCYMEAEAGMGKTRLLEEVVAHAQDDVLCLVGKCESFRSNISYWPLIDMLQGAALPEVSSLSGLRSLLGLRAPDARDRELADNLPPEALRQELHARVRDFLLEAAIDGPTLLVVEDIHWLDLSTLDLVDYLLPLTMQAPVSILLVARAEMPGSHRALVRKAERVCKCRYLRISFSGLSERDTHTVVCALLNAASVPPGVMELLKPFVGHPLAIEEALRFLVESGWLRRSEDGWRLREFDHAGERVMPGSFRDLVLARHEALENETLHVLQSAAVLGETFDRAVLSQMIPNPTLKMRLAELVERGWLFPPEARNPLQFRFRHTLTRETIYSTLMRSKLQLLHQRAGEAIESLYPEAQEEFAELLAHHFWRSSLREKTLYYSVRAAQKSYSRCALAEGLAYYRRADEIAQDDSHPQPSLLARIRLGLADIHLDLGDARSVAGDLAPLFAEPSAELKVACLRRTGSARQALGEHQAAMEDFRQALAALQLATRRGQSMQTSPLGPIDRERLSIYLGMAQTLFEMRDNEGAEKYVQYVVEAGDAGLYPSVAADALSLLGGVKYRQGDLKTSRRLVKKSLAIHQAAGNRVGAGAAYANLGLLDAERGDVQGAQENLGLALSIHEALGNVAGIATTHNNLGQLAARFGDLAQAGRHLALAAESARQSELTQLQAQALANLARVLLWTGSGEDALKTLDQAESISRNYSFRDLLCEVLWNRSECLSELGNEREAATVGEAALELANELDSADLIGESRRALARALRRQGTLGRALHLAELAWQTGAEDSDQRLRARFAAEYALTLLAAGRGGQARELLDRHIRHVEIREARSVIQELRAAYRSLAVTA